MSKKPDSRLLVGLMSGTSLDGIDAVLVEIRSDPFAVQTLETLSQPFEPQVISELRALADGWAGIDQLCRANVALGRHYADSVNALLTTSGKKATEILAIGCHGQTVRHLPAPAESLSKQVIATLQIEDPATLAERTGITVVSNFRARDMAAGGQGAPLVPYLDYLLFADKNIGRAILNIGGIANVTLLPPNARVDEVLAFDTGPGNVLMDTLAFEISGGSRRFDRDGEMAAGGRILTAVLQDLLSQPYLEQAPPKSTGREEFGRHLLEKYLDSTCNRRDLMATLALYTARTITQAVNKFWPGSEPPNEVVSSGGGVHNKTLMKLLKQELGEISLRTSDDFGVNADFKEAVAFAVLADATLHGKPGNIPSATGADRPVVLGNITPG